MLKRVWIYAIGVTVLGALYQLLKTSLDAPLLTGMTIVLLIAIRLLADKYGK